MKEGGGRSAVCAVGGGTSREMTVEGWIVKGVAAFWVAGIVAAVVSVV